MIVSTAQLRAARALLGLSASDIASLAGLSVDTVNGIENGGERAPELLRSLRTLLEDRGIAFLSDDMDGGIGVRLRGPSGDADTGLRPENLNAANDD